MVKLRQKFAGAHQRPRAVADEVFHRVGELGEGLGVAVGHEEWVVAEATGAAWCERDRAFADAFGEVEHGAVRISDGDYGDETGTAIASSSVSEFGEKQGAAIGVGGVRTGIARGEDSGRAIECRDFQSRIVSECA